MLFGDDRNRLRRYYLDAWRKSQRGEPLEPLEQQIADLIARHPEYQDLFSAAAAHPNGEAALLQEEYTPERGMSNPFLHLGLHLGLQEQLASNRPPGITGIFHELARRTSDPHAAEHRMMECLAETLWQAQRDRTLPDETAYLERLRRLL